MKKLSESEIANIIKKNWHISNPKISKLINNQKSASTISRWGSKMGLPEKQSGGLNILKLPKTSVKEQIEVDKMENSMRKDKGVIDKKYKSAISRIVDLENQIDIIYKTKDKINPTYFKYKPITKDTESVAVVLASDWHIEEQVKIEWTNGMNEYNLDIAKRCSEIFFQNTVKLLEKEAHSTKIDTLVLALLGDFITNYLHDENVETCLLGPADAICFAQELLVAGIQYLLDNTKVKIIIPCHVGNHSRTTDKVHFSTESGNSWETVIYKNMQLWFKSQPRVTFLLSKAYISYLDLGGYTIAFHHGHGFRFGGAIGGITTAVVKWRDKTEQARKADLYCFGHHHTQFDGRLFLANGSMIGYGARAQALGYAYEPRSQTFFLVNLKYKRKTVVVPILFAV